MWALTRQQGAVGWILLGGGGVRQQVRLPGLPPVVTEQAVALACQRLDRGLLTHALPCHLGSSIHAAGPPLAAGSTHTLAFRRLKM